MPANDPDVRRTVATIAALSRWSKQDTSVGIAPARKGFMAKFEREVDPDNSLSPAERATRAQRAMKAHMTRLSLASKQKRSAA